MHAVNRALHNTQLKVLLIPLATGFVLGWAGTNSLSGMPRFPSALGGAALALVGWCASHLGTLAFQRLGAGRIALLPLLFLGALVSGIITVPGSYAIYEFFHQLGYPVKGWSAIYDYSVSRALAAAPGSIVFWMAINIILVRSGIPRFGFGVPEAAPAAPDQREALDRLLARVRPEVRGPILAVEAEAHFIRIHTTRGQDLIHHRFSDAVAALTALPGERVHRSWWVAAGAIDPASKGSNPLRLVNGLEVPVGRTYLLDAKRAGLLA